MRVRSRLSHLVAGSRRYGPVFLAEVIVFWLILMAVDESGYGPGVPQTPPDWFISVSLAMVIFGMAAGEMSFHLYRRVWSVASLNDAFAVGMAVIEATLLVTIVNLIFPDGDRPLRVLAPILAAPAAVIGIGLIRLLPRLATRSRPTGNRLLVVIPDVSGYATVRALLQHPNPDWTPVGVVSAGYAEVGRTLMGVPVLGTTKDLRRHISASVAHGVAFVQGAAFSRAQARALYGVCLAERLPVFIIPAADEWFPRPSASRLRQLSADDLVGRDQREIELEKAAGDIRDKTVLVTGAAGTIGSELCRLVATMHPRRLVLVDNNESGLFDLGEELRISGTLDV